MKLSQFNSLKCLAQADKIRMILAGKIPPPSVLNLDLTNKCNFKCKHCYVEDIISNRIEMPAKVAIKIIRGAAAAGVKSILFTGGGEPTLHPSFINCVEEANIFKMSIGLTTNGSNLNQFGIWSILPYFKYIRISVDAGTKETYTKIHGTSEDMFGRVLEQASRIIDTKSCTVGMAFLVTPHNYTELREALKLAEDVGFDYLSIRPTVFGELLTTKQLAQTAIISNNLKSETVKIYPITARFKSLITKESYPCVSTPLVSVVTADAKLNLCCQYRGNPKYQWGDLTKNSFQELWGNKEHQELIASADSSKCPVCRMISYNEIIEDVFVNDKMHLGFL